MKKILLLFAIAVASFSPAHAQIINGSFESWTNDLPDGWWAYDIPGYDLYAQSTSAHSGTYAVTLRVDTIGGNAAATPLSTGDGVNSQTHPLGIVPNSITFWYRLNANGNDNVSLSAVVYSGGNAVGSAFAMVSAAATYTMVSTPVYYGVPPATADSIAMIFLVSNQSGTPNAGSQAWIDDVSVSVNSAVEENAVSEFRLLPNPADDYINLSLPGEAAVYEIYISDVTAKRVYASTSAGKYVRVETLDFKPGFYHCLVKAGDKEYRKPFIVRHR